MRRRHRTRALHPFWIALLSCTPASAWGADDPPEWRRRGDRAPSEAWNALEGKPAPSLASLDHWVHLEPVDWADLAGNVVLVAQFESWMPKVSNELEYLVDLYVQHSIDGLVILPVHSPKNLHAFEVLQKQTFIPLPMAVDVDGKFASATSTPRYPTYHLVGRDGTVRIAGMNTRRDKDGVRLIEKAITSVLEEPWEGEPRRIQLDLPSDRLEKLDTRKSGMVRPDEEEKVPLVLDASGWPAHVDKPLHSHKDLRGMAAPELVAEKWFGETPVTEGRCWLMVLMSTDSMPSLRFLPKLAKIQDKFSDRLTVAAISFQAPYVNQKDGRPWADMLERFFEQHDDYKFHGGYDGNKTMENLIGARGLPYALLVDSRGIVRWQGYPMDNRDLLTKKLVGAVLDRDARQEDEQGEGEDGR